LNICLIAAKSDNIILVYGIPGSGKSMTPTPQPKTAYDAPYDIAAIIAETKAYGESIGMAWGELLVIDGGSWEAPVATSPTMSGERLKAAIENSLQRSKKLQTDNGYQAGQFCYKVVFEPNENGEYKMYFLLG